MGLASEHASYAYHAVLSRIPIMLGFFALEVWEHCCELVLEILPARNLHRKGQ